MHEMHVNKSCERKKIRVRKLIWDRQRSVFQKSAISVCDVGIIRRTNKKAPSHPHNFWTVTSNFFLSLRWILVNRSNSFNSKSRRIDSSSCQSKSIELHSSLPLLSQSVRVSINLADLYQLPLLLYILSHRYF